MANKGISRRRTSIVQWWSLWASLAAFSYHVGDTQAFQQHYNHPKRRQVSSSSALLSMMKVSTGVSDVMDDNDVFILDMWGVMHDGSKPYDGVVETVRKLKEAGKRLIILSNSSQRRDNSCSNLVQLGFNPDDFEQVITSGEVAFQMLSGNHDSLGCQPWSILTNLISDDDAKKVFVLGSGSGDEEYCNACGWTLAPIEEANLILARGTFSVNDGTTEVNKREDPEGYELVLAECLKKAATRKLPMIVSNPDKVRPDEERPPMPGAIGDLYENELGGGDEASSLVKRIGKPFRDVYDIALSQVGDSSRACMVGDALETDITGGSSVGINTLWVLEDGIHCFEVVERGSTLEEGATSVLEEFNQKKNTYAKGRILSPSAVVRHFNW